jgi:hypothetical protein
VVDIFDEIREEANEEKWLNLWKKYQNHIYGVIMVCVLATAGHVYWKRHTESKSVEASEKFIHALESIQRKGMKTAIGLLEEIPLNQTGAYKDLSRLLVASLLQEEGDEEGARDVYRSIVNDGGGDAVYSDLALLRLAYMGFDVEDPKTLLKSLEPLTKESSPWKFSALELMALLSIKMGDTAKAKDVLTRLINQAKDNKDAPSFVAFRAESLLRSLEKDLKKAGKDA